MPPRPTKRELIVDAARDLFLEHGFGATSMDAISNQARVSKPTLYSHFKSKEALFSEVMISLCHEGDGPRPTELFHLGAPPEDVLGRVAEAMLKCILQPTGLALFREALSESQRFPELGQTFWETGPKEFIECMATYLISLDNEGRLSVPDPSAAARQFFGLVVGTYVFPVLMGVMAMPSDKEISRGLKAMVSSFLKGLAPD